MGRLTPSSRELVFRFRKQGISIKELVIAFKVSRVTIWFWSGCFLKTMKNMPRLYESKITIEAEVTILFLRSLGYGCARIKQRLECAPEIELNLTEIFIQGLIVSRQTVYNVLKKHKLNGYPHKRKKAWNFFRAKYPNELWQLDLKEFKFEGRKYYFVVCIDDYSRYLIVLKLLNHCPTTKEITSLLQNLGNKPEKILVDNGGQFREQWKDWCKENEIEAIFAHPYYPQDKGKVERTNRNIAEELVNIIMRFHKLFTDKKIEGWMKWYNKNRKSLGIEDYPERLYVKI